MDTAVEAKSVLFCRLALLPIEVQDKIAEHLGLHKQQKPWAPILVLFWDIGDGIATDWNNDYDGLETGEPTPYQAYSKAEFVAIKALISWSSTCSFYRNLFASRLFRDLLLRIEPKSMLSVHALSKTSHWKHVESLTLSPRFPKNQRYISGSKYHRRQLNLVRDLDHECLDQILSNLPPKLKSLALDFPSYWPQKGKDDFGPLDPEETPEQTVVVERTLKLRKLVYTVMSAVSRSDFSSKQGFVLQLSNLPPMPCTAYSTPGFHQFLNHVTHFTILLSNWAYHVTKLVDDLRSPWQLFRGLGHWFFDHLTKAVTLNFYTNGPWPNTRRPGISYFCT